MAFNFNPAGIRTVPQDYSWLSNLPEDFWKGQAVGRQNQLRDELSALPKGPDGTPDLKAAAALILKNDPARGAQLIQSINNQEALNNYRTESLKPESQRLYDWAYPPTQTAPASVPGTSSTPQPSGAMNLGPDNRPSPQDFVQSQLLGKTLTPGQKSLDEGFAKDYRDWVSGGGYAGIQKTQGQLGAAIEQMKGRDDISGPFIGLLGDVAKGGGITGGAANLARNYFLPEAKNVQQQIEEAIQTNLRRVLGSQYTQQEGENLLSRTYDPGLDEGINIARAKRVLAQLDQMGQAKDSAARYFEQKGTLQGWQGRLPQAGDTGTIDMGEEGPPAKSQDRLTPGASNPQPSQASTLSGRYDENGFEKRPGFVNTEKQTAGQAPPGGPDIRWKTVRNPEGIPPSQEAVDVLKQNANNPKARTIFEAIYGKGSADFILSAPGR